MDIITSPQNPKVKHAQALQSRAKTRRKSQQIVLEGTRLVRDAWQHAMIPDTVFVTEDADAALVDELRGADVRMMQVDPAIMRAMSDTETPQGILGVFPMPAPTLPAHAQQIVILDALRDPGNVGTLIRTAAGAGADALILAPGCADPYNPKTLRSGMGAHFRLPVIEMAWAQIHAALSVSAIYLADGAAEVAYDQVDWRQAWALIIGSEAHGAGADARRTATHPITIPMARATESLNAAAAAAVILFEAARQRRRDRER